MKKLIYLLRRIRNMNFKNMFKVAKDVKKINHRPVLFIIIDMIYSGFTYGAGYMDYFEFEFYLLNKGQRKTYLTAVKNNQIIAKYNDKEKSKIFNNKVMFNNTFKEYVRHDFIDLRECSKDDFKLFCDKHKRIVGKVVDECGGKGIDIYDVSNIDVLFDTLMEKEQYLVEEAVIQHSDLNKLYPKSVNTLRVISFVKDDGSVEILNTVLRIGNGGVVDNFSSGGMYTFVSDEGIVLIPAIDEAGHIYHKHPITNVDIVGYNIPSFDEVKEFVKKIALVVPEVRYVGFDITVSENGPVLIEGNEYSGVFQMKCSLSGKKEGLLPKYKKYMDI